MMKCSSLYGRNENMMMNDTAGTIIVFSFGAMNSPIGTNIVLKPRARGMAEYKYHRYGDV